MHKCFVNRGVTATIPFCSLAQQMTLLPGKPIVWVQLLFQPPARGRKDLSDTKPPPALLQLTRGSREPRHQSRRTGTLRVTGAPGLTARCAHTPLRAHQLQCSSSSAARERRHLFSKAHPHFHFLPAGHLQNLHQTSNYDQRSSAGCSLLSLLSG